MSQKPKLVSALGAIPKTPGNSAIRIIHDASRPDNTSLNVHAWHNPFSYQRIQNAVDLIKPGYFLAKLDLASAHRSVKVNPSNFVATGLKWTFSGDDVPTYMVDTRLPFGMMRDRGYPSIVNYLDDYIIIGDSYSDCRTIGFAINYNKVECPVQRLTFLGILLDTVAMSMELPEKKLTGLKELLQKASMSKKLTKQQLQSLAGKLKALRQDIHVVWWLHFMQPFNGLTPIVDNRPVSPIWTVAAGCVYNEMFL